jgi:hypothetical protein
MAELGIRMIPHLNKVFGMTFDSKKVLKLVPCVSMMNKASS